MTDGSEELFLFRRYRYRCGHHLSKQNYLLSLKKKKKKERHPDDAQRYRWSGAPEHVMSKCRLNRD